MREMVVRSMVRTVRASRTTALAGVAHYPPLVRARAVRTPNSRFPIPNPITCKKNEKKFVIGSHAAHTYM